MESKYSISLFFLSSDRGLVWGAHIVLLIATLALIFGFRPRLAAIIVYLLHLSFDQRNPLVAYGFNKVAVFFLITLILASYHPQQAPVGSLRRSLASIALRFAQIELCIIYLFSGTEKLKGLTWWRGEALWGVLSNSQTTSFDFSMAAQFPLVLTLLTFATLIWEIYFPALVWVKGTRYLWLLGGVCLHAGIGITMNIPFFAAVMVVAYSVFLDKKDAERLEQFFLSRVKGLRERLQKFKFLGSTGIEPTNPTSVSE